AMQGARSCPKPAIGITLARTAHMHTLLASLIADLLGWRLGSGLPASGKGVGGPLVSVVLAARVAPAERRDAENRAGDGRACRNLARGVRADLHAAGTRDAVRSVAQRVERRAG